MDNRLDRRQSLNQELSSVELSVVGKMPSWLSGTLIRNGPAKFECGKKRLHWLDGLAMLHAFSIDQGKVTYTNKFLRTDYYEAVQKGKMPYRTFASDPCRSLFRNVTSLFHSRSKLAQNANVNITKIAEHFVALTEVPLSIEFDPKTLETIGTFNFDDALETGLRFETAHPHYDAKESLNYYTKYGPTCSYNLFRVPHESTTRELIASLPIKEPAYMHTFAVTPNYLLLTEFPFFVNPLKLLLKNRPFIDNFVWKRERGIAIHVFERKTGKVVGSYLSDPFFAFHHVNAFETSNGILFDIVTYEDPSLIWLPDMLFDVPKRLTRFDLRFDRQKVASHHLGKVSMELPKIHYEKFNGLPYRFVYGVGNQGQIHKFDVENAATTSWHQEGSQAGEPIFVAAPNASSEDDGVILSIVLDSKNSFLLVLDGKTFFEICRATVPHAIPIGLHGRFFSA